MTPKKITEYVSYVVGAVALVALVVSNPIATVALVLAGLVNVFYTRK